MLKNFNFLFCIKDKAQGYHGSCNSYSFFDFTGLVEDMYTDMYFSGIFTWHIYMHVFVLIWSKTTPAS